MQIQLKPWGNSQGIRFSREFLALAGIGPSDTLTAEIVDGKIIPGGAPRRLPLRISPGSR